MEGQGQMEQRLCVPVFGEGVRAETIGSGDNFMWGIRRKKGRRRTGVLNLSGL